MPSEPTPTHQPSAAESKPTPKHSVWRWCVGVFTALLKALLMALLLLALLVATLPWLATPLLNRTLPALLERANIRADTVAIKRIHWSGVELAALSLELGDGTRVSINEGLWEMSWRHLRQGEWGRVSIRSVAVTLPTERVKKVAKNAAERIENTDFSEYELPPLAGVFDWPLQSLHIERFALTHPNAQLLGSVRLNNADDSPVWGITGNVQVFDGSNQTSPTLSAELDARLKQTSSHSGVLTLALLDGDTALLQLNVNIEQQDTPNPRMQFKVEQSLSVQALQTRLSTLSDAPQLLDQQTLSATIELPMSGRLPHDMSVMARGNLIGAHRPWLAQVSGALGQWQWTLAKPNAKSAWQWSMVGKPHKVRWVAASEDASVDASAQKSAEAKALNAKAAKEKSANAASHSQLVSELALTTSKPIHITGECDTPLLNCQLDAHTQIHVQTPKPTQGFKASLELRPSLRWQRGHDAEFALPLSAHATFGDNIQSLAPVASASMQGRVQGWLNEQGTWQVSSTRGFKARVALLPFDGWSSNAPLTLSLLQGFALNGGDTLRLNALTARAAAMTLTHTQDERRLVLTPASLSCLPDLGRWQLDGAPPRSVQPVKSSREINLETNASVRCSIDAGLAPSKWQQWPLPDMNIQGTLDYQHALASVRWQGHIRGFNTELDLALQAKHELRSGVGSLQFHLRDLHTNWARVGLGEMLNLTKVSLLGGRVSGQGWLDWNADGQLTPDIMLRMDELSGAYNNTVVFEHWQGLMSLRQPHADFELDMQLSGDSVNAGVPFTNVLARANVRVPKTLDYAKLTLHQAQAQTLGGRIILPNVSMDSRESTQAFSVKLEHILLRDVAAIEPSANISAEGILDGSVPIVIDTDGVHVPLGKLLSRSPGGVVRYQSPTSEALKSTNEVSGFVWQALENFQYDVLSSTIKYEPDGTLLIGAQLRGKNPDFFDGQATNLNINLDYNLLDLLESLRLTQDLVGRIEEKYGASQ